MTRYFDHLNTAEELRTEYRRLAVLHHPDHGGDTATMAAINSQYDEAEKRISRAPGQQAAGADAAGAAESFDRAAFLAAIRAAAIHPDLVLELVGAWLWCTGNTYAHRDALKAAGYRYSHGKKAWYYRDEEHATGAHASRKSLDEIKEKYGARRILSAAAAANALPA